MGMAETLRLEWRSPGELAENPANWRRHPEGQLSALTDVISEVGWAGACLFNERTGRLIDGHARRKVALQQGTEKVPVLVGDWDEATEKKILATLDPIAAMADADKASLDALLREVNTGSEALQTMLTDLASDAGLYVEPTQVSEDEVPEPPPTPITKPGDLWILGGHRLLCGDSTDAAAVAKLMDGGKASLCFTSPPYAQQREYDPGSGFRPIPPDGYSDWWEAIQANVRAHLTPDGSFFLNVKEHCEDGQRHLYVKDLAIAHVRRWGWRFVEEYIWTHEGTPINAKADGRFKNAWEPVFHFALARPHKIRPDNVLHESDRVAKWVPGRGNKTSQGNYGINGDVAPGLALPSNNVRVNKGEGRDDSAVHGAKFPVGLPGFFIRAFSDAGDAVYEPFSGSGTTLIAAEQLGRRCYAMEISPAYCDVAVQRWEKLTGKKAERA